MAPLHLAGKVKQLARGRKRLRPAHSYIPTVIVRPIQRRGVAIMTFTEILATEPRRDDGCLPVIFDCHEPQLLGHAATQAEADALASARHVSATFCSRATLLLENGRHSNPFFILHG
jgi:hypothetical protein